MPNLRAQVEAVLQKHLNRNSAIFPNILDDLVALYPKPSRHKLQGILISFRNQANRFDLIEEAVWAWATGTTGRTWCPHWGWTGTHWRYLAEPDLHLLLASGGQWDCCPVSGCHAPRPQEPG